MGHNLTHSCDTASLVNGNWQNFLNYAQNLYASNSNQLPAFTAFAFGCKHVCCVCNIAKAHRTRRKVMGRTRDSPFFLFLANAPWLHKLLAQFFFYFLSGSGETETSTPVQRTVKRSFRFLTFLCALACSSTYFWTSLISSCSFLTSSMWQLASFSVELLNTSHTGAKVLARTTTTH